jgi:hypothetical protein
MKGGDDAGDHEEDEEHTLRLTRTRCRAMGHLTYQGRFGVAGTAAGAGRCLRGGFGSVVMVPPGTGEWEGVGGAAGLPGFGADGSGVQGFTG